MWITAFLLGMMLSLGANAKTCNITSVEGIVSLLKQSPQEKHYRDINDRLLELRYEQETRGSRPEFSAGINFDKHNSKNKEITAELLFNIDDYRNDSIRKKLKGADKNLKSTEFQKDYNERIYLTAVSLFKISQSQFMMEKVEGLLRTITSSESIYQNRPIRSRDDEIVLSSLGLLKNNLTLKKNRLQDQVFENQTIAKKWDSLGCSIEYTQYSQLINNLESFKQDESQLTSLKVLQLKGELDNLAIELEIRRYFGNFKIGPSFSSDRNDQIDEYRFGVSLSFDIPSLDNSNSAYINYSREIAGLEKKRAERNSGLDKDVIEDRFKKYSDSLKSLPTSEKLENDIRKIKKSFDAGVVSPLVYLESYRSYIDFLEVSEEVRLNVLENYFKLRGLYVESNSY